MTLASEARAAVRRRPFLRSALAAGVVNYSAAARYLDVGEVEAVAAALRRYADELSPPDPPTADVRVDMRSGFAAVTAPDADALLTVGDTAFVTGGGDRTAVIATGDLSVAHLASVLARLDAEGVSVVAAGGAEGHLACLVDRRDGVDALRYVEDALDT